MDENNKIICESLLNSNSYILSALNASDLNKNLYDNYSFSWLALLKEKELEIVFMSAIPARFTTSTTHNMGEETHDKIYFAPAVEAIKTKQTISMQVSKNEIFPSRRENDPKFSSLLAIPLYIDEKVYAVFTIYSLLESIDKSEIKMLQQLALDMTLAINKDKMDELVGSLRVY